MKKRYSGYYTQYLRMQYMLFLMCAWLQDTQNMFHKAHFHSATNQFQQYTQLDLKHTSTTDCIKNMKYFCWVFYQNGVRAEDLQINFHRRSIIFPLREKVRISVEILFEKLKIQSKKRAQRKKKCLLYIFVWHHIFQ